MQKGIRPGTEKRCEMLKTFLGEGYVREYDRSATKKMRGKTEQEKEVIAAQIIKETGKKK